MDPHKVLGLDKNASREQIKRAYRQKAKKYHPDAGGDAWAFNQVQEAYAQLTGKKVTYKKKDAPRNQEPKPNEQEKSDHREEKNAGTSSSERPPPEARSAPPPQQFHHFDFSGNASQSTRRKRKSGYGIHIIGVVFGGICSLLLVYVVVKYDLVRWTRAEFSLSDPRLTDPPAQPNPPPLIESTPPIDTESSTKKYGTVFVDDNKGRFQVLEQNSRLFVDRDFVWVEIPLELKGLVFWQNSSAHAETTLFTVDEPGIVILAALFRAENHVTRKQLIDDGWERIGILVENESGTRRDWDLFRRNCERGNSFSYRTDIYCAPIPITKKNPVSD